MEKQIHWGSGRQEKSGSSRGVGQRGGEEMESSMELREGMSVAGGGGGGRLVRTNGRAEGRQKRR